MDMCRELIGSKCEKEGEAGSHTLINLQGELVCEVGLE